MQDNGDYIDLNTLVNSELYYQFDLNNETLKINNVGNGNYVGDILIKENVLKNNEYSIYSTIYSEQELLELHNKFIPLLIIRNKKTCYSIGIIVYQKIELNEKNINNFDVFCVYNIDKLYKIKINKDVNKENIIEKLIEHLIDMNIFIL